MNANVSGEWNARYRRSGKSDFRRRFFIVNVTCYCSLSVGYSFVLRGQPNGFPCMGKIEDSARSIFVDLESGLLLNI